MSDSEYEFTSRLSPDDTELTESNPWETLRKRIHSETYFDAAQSERTAVIRDGIKYYLGTASRDEEKIASVKTRLRAVREELRELGFGINGDVFSPGTQPAVTRVVAERLGVRQTDVMLVMTGLLASKKLVVTGHGNYLRDRVEWSPETSDQE